MSCSNKGCYSHCSSLGQAASWSKRRSRLCGKDTQHPRLCDTWHSEQPPPFGSDVTLIRQTSDYRLAPGKGCLPRRECTEHSKRWPPPFSWCWAGWWSRFWAVRDEPWPWMGQRAAHGWQISLKFFTVFFFFPNERSISFLSDNKRKRQKKKSKQKMGGGILWNFSTLKLHKS